MNLKAFATTNGVGITARLGEITSIEIEIVAHTDGFVTMDVSLNAYYVDCLTACIDAFASLHIGAQCDGVTSATCINYRELGFGGWKHPAVAKIPHCTVARFVVLLRVDAIVGDETCVAQKEGVGTTARNSIVESRYWIERFGYEMKGEKTILLADLRQGANIFGEIRRCIERLIGR